VAEQVRFYLWMSLRAAAVEPRLFDLVWYNIVWGLSVRLSILAGSYPAWKALRLPPIVVVRRE
jgi:ABC-type lipoprotein release transport system permease subunit